MPWLHVCVGRMPCHISSMALSRRANAVPPFADMPSAQFVGSESSADSIPLIENLSKVDQATLFAFSVEMINNLDGTVADLDEMIAQSKRKGKASSSTNTAPINVVKSKHIYHNVLQELIDSVTVGAQIAKRDDWRSEADPSKAEVLKDRPTRYGGALVAIKLSGILRDPSVLVRASQVLVDHKHFSAPPEGFTLPPFSVNARPGSDEPGAGLPLPLSKLSSEDAEAMAQLWSGARKLCAHSAQAGPTVRLIVDAEYTAMQPALDAIADGLAYEFNRLPSAAEAQERTVAAGGQLVRGPLVFNTYQAYLRRTPAYLASCLDRARENNYALGVKLVRGAYYDQENMKAGCPAAGLDSDMYHEQLFAVHRALNRRELPPLDPAVESDGWDSPIWPTKRLTDQSYDGCALALVDLLAADIKHQSQRIPAKWSKDGNEAPDWPQLSVIFASHNWQTDMKVLRRMVQRGLLLPPESNTGEPSDLHRPESSTADHAPAVASSSVLTTDEAERDFFNLRVAPGVRGRAMFGQLYGMSDILTQRMTQAFDSASGGEGPHMVLKYVPYGPMELVMPYLVRRAIENKTVLHGSQPKGRLPPAQEERTLFAREVLNRVNPLSAFAREA